MNLKKLPTHYQKHAPLTDDNGGGGGGDRRHYGNRKSEGTEGALLNPI